MDKEDGEMSDDNVMLVDDDLIPTASKTKINVEDDYTVVSV